ncbi:MAG: hypothetical protein ABI412_06965 [Sphingomicrobium sp.]
MMLLLPMLVAAPPPMIQLPPPVSINVRGRNVPMTPTRALAAGMVRLRPEEAVIKASEAGSPGVVGVFDLSVVIANEVDRRIFLGTQPDYRDQRNLAIAIEPDAFRGLMSRYGAPIVDKLRGKHLLVIGKAVPVKISINDELGRPTGKYYFQTHVAVTHPEQIEIIGD